MIHRCVLDVAPEPPVVEFFKYQGGVWIVAAVCLLCAAAVAGIVLICRKNKKKAAEKDGADETK